MSKFSGRQHKGAARVLREIKRNEAQERDAVSEHAWQGRRARAGDLDPRTYRFDLDFAGTRKAFRKPVSR